MTHGIRRHDLPAPKAMQQRGAMWPWEQYTTVAAHADLDNEAWPRPMDDVRASVVIRPEPQTVEMYYGICGVDFEVLP